jgi:hypothetical protein
MTTTAHTLNPIRIGDITLTDNAILAPMTGVSDLPFRRLVKSFGAGLVVSEMIASKAVVLETRNALRMAQSEVTERPFSVQLAGCDPEIMAEAAKLNEDRGLYTRRGAGARAEVAPLALGACVLVLISVECIHLLREGGLKLIHGFGFMQAEIGANGGPDGGFTKRATASGTAQMPPPTIAPLPRPFSTVLTVECGGFVRVCDLNVTSSDIASL